MSTTRPLTCSVFIATSLDGFIARPDGSIDWLSMVEVPGEDYGYAAFAKTVDTLVMGRNTYEVTVGFPEWPHVGKRCVVMTHRPLEPRHGEVFFAGTANELVERLRDQGARHVYVDGGAVIRQFLEARLIDELTVSIVPIVLGSGIPLFGAMRTEQRLRLLDSRSFPSGLTQLRYAPT